MGNLSSDLRHELEVLLDAAESNSPQAGQMLRQFSRAFSEEFGVDERVLIDKMRMEKPKVPELDTLGYRRHAKKALSDLFVRRGQLAYLTPGGPAGPHDRHSAYGLKVIITCFQRVEGLSESLNEDPSGYTTAFTHPDPMDPNDRKRQQTQARAGNYPYDMPTSYGQPQGTDSGGASYQMSPTTTPPQPEHQRASDWKPKDPWNLANEVLEGTLDPYEPGPQADDAFGLGYGNHGRLGDDIDMDDLRKSYREMVPTSELPGIVMGLLSILLPDEEGDDSCDGCDAGILIGDDT